MSVVMAPSGGVPLQPGYVFGGRYRLVDWIRRDWAGEVWRADDLVLHTPVALQIVREDIDARDEVLERVRLAREVTHPAVCRVFDIGEAEGRIYYSMELVGGESLYTLIRRVGRLPSEKVLEIGRQMCAGLAAVHARGGVHGNLDASNVLLDRDGSVCLTGIGFTPPSDAAALAALTEVGATEYLAPEQRLPGGMTSAKADLYAAGVVLYELLAGSPPDAALVRVMTRGRRRRVINGADPRLERVILQALDPDPSRRPPSAAAMAAALGTASPAEPRHHVRVWAAGAALAAVIATIAVLAARFLPNPPAVVTAHDTIVVTDFVNTTGEEVFDGALKVALAVALEQSPFLRVFPDDRARDTLRLMQRNPDERLTAALAREIAQREQLKALVTGSIGHSSDRYVLELAAVAASTGEVIAREQAEVGGREEVLSALGAAAARLRGSLGESLASIARYDARLPEATTASLDALHAYALALDHGRMVPRVEAVPHLLRAIALDPDFALAQAALSGVYRNTGRSAEAPEFSRRAYELRERVSERERFFISWRYFMDALHAWDQALELAISWTQTYPGEPFAFNSLGLAAAAFGDHDQAVRAFREAIRLDSRFVPPHGNLAGSLIASGHFAEAKSLLAEAQQRGIGFITVRRMAYLLAFIDNDQAAMARELELVRNSREAAWAPIFEGRALAFSGRFQDAHERFQQGVQRVLADGADELGAQWTVEDAELHAIAGDCIEARRETGDALRLSRDVFTLERAGRTLALCGDVAELTRVATELTDRFPGATLTARIHLPIMHAADALRRDDPLRAVDLLDGVRPYDNAPSAEFWPAYLRGQAYLRVKDPRAAAQFRTILQQRGAAPTSPLTALAHLQLARAEVLAGNLAEARAAYETGFSLWSGADPGLQPVAEARGEYTRLR